MKKLLAMLLSLALALGLLACGSVHSSGGASEDRLTLEKLQQAESKEALAALVGVSELGQMEQLLVYLKNYEAHLPSEDASEPVSEWGRTADGMYCLTAAEARTLVTPVVLTTENWKDYVEAAMNTVTFQYSDGSEAEEELAEIDIKSGWYPSTKSFLLKLTNEKSGESLEFDGYYWPEEVLCEEGVFYTVSWDESGAEQRVPFSVDNYSCSYADAVVYSYALNPEYCYVQDPEEWDKFQTATEADLADGGAFVVVQYGNEPEEICYVGYHGFGSYAYTGDSTESYTDSSEKTVTPAKSTALSLSLLQGLKTREELAAALGVSRVSGLKQLVAYLINYYRHADAADADTAPVTEWHTTADGLNYLTPAELRTLITPAVVTTENWKDYVKATTETVRYISYDDKGNELLEVAEEPIVGFPPEYHSVEGRVTLIFKNNQTGELLSYDGQNSYLFGSAEDFDPEAYSCLYADCVVYSYDLPAELRYIEYYDEAAEEWALVHEDEYEGNDGYTEVLLSPDGTEENLAYYGYEGLGSVFVDFE